MLKHLAIIASAGVFLSQAIYANERYPQHPDPQLTPGSTCAAPDAYRYPEHIPYCNRNVSTSTKRQIIRTYDSTFGYSVESINRSLVKIDHYIPLCMGGSNQTDNLWPQYKDIYEQTDALEGRLCELLAQAKMTQADAIERIRRSKNDFSSIEGIWDEISRLDP